MRILCQRKIKVELLFLGKITHFCEGKMLKGPVCNLQKLSKDQFAILVTFPVAAWQRHGAHGDAHAPILQV